MGATSGRGKRPVAGRKREVRHVTPDACRPAGREAPVVLALGAPLRFTAAAESSQLCKSVNLGVQAVEVAELGLVLGVVTLLFLRFSVVGPKTQPKYQHSGTFSAVPPLSRVSEREPLRRGAGALECEPGWAVGREARGGQVTHRRPHDQTNRPPRASGVCRGGEGTAPPLGFRGRGKKANELVISLFSRV